MPDPRVIVADEDRSFLELLEFILLKDGFVTSSASDGPGVVELARNGSHDVAVFSAGLAGMDGIAICRKIRRNAATTSLPLVVMTSERDRGTAVTALDAGAHDILVKPFAPCMLLEKLRALLGTAGSSCDASPRKIGDLLIDERKHEVQAKGKFVDLTPTEFHILTVLASNAGRPLSRRFIVKATRGWAHVTERSVDFHIVGLRRKLEACSGMLDTVRGIGYRLRDRVVPRAKQPHVPRRRHVHEGTGTG